MSIVADEMIIPDWFEELHFAFSRKNDGQMSFKRADIATVTANRLKFLNNYKLDPESIIAAELTHGSQVATVGGTDRGRGATSTNWIESVDGLVTKDTSCLLLTTHADCSPVVIYDSNRVLGQAHAGWRGLAAGIIKELACTVHNVSNSPMSEIKAWIGPTIHSCCYQVSTDVANQFPTECSTRSGDDVRLDLVKFIKLELDSLGLHQSNVTDSSICTSCVPEFASFRRDGDGVVAMACVTGLK